MNRFVPLVCDGQPGGHHVIASTRRFHGSVKPASRAADGAKRSGLSGPWTAGQSRVVMAAVHAAALQVRELARRSRRAGGREAGGRRSMPPQFWIQSECALTYMNARSGQNLSAVRTPLVNVGGHVVESPAHSAMARDRARICRTTATCIWGVSVPLIAAVGPRSGGGRGGRSRPDVSIVVTDSGVDCDTGGRQRRPIDSAEVAARKEHRHFAIDAITFLSWLVDRRTDTSKGGTTPPESVVPPCFLRFRGFLPISRGETWASNAGSAWYSGARRIES